VFVIQRPQASELTVSPPAAQEVETTPSTRRSFIKPLFLIVFSLLIVGGTGFGLYFFWPFGPESVPKRTDIELLHLVETRGYFIDNQKSGQLFVIEGRLRNDFPKSRRWVSLRATLYTADGRAAQQLDFYAGNMLSNQQLQNMPLGELHGRIQQRPDTLERARMIPAQDEVGFIVPFGNLPELSQLSDYSVEILASQPR
jgi:hypothetical protein